MQKFNLKTLLLFFIAPWNSRPNVQDQHMTLKMSKEFNSNDDIMLLGAAIAAELESTNRGLQRRHPIYRLY